jgi:SAM-dependent methyltransferase
MSTPAKDKAFTGSVPQIYDELLVPMIFTPYAEDLVARLAARAPRSVLEIAAGTGAVTRRLASVLPETTRIVATDLNPPMLERAASIGTVRPVDWRVVDAQQLPFADASFDAVACQFGVMFFPDKARAFAEARRVLRPGGRLLFNVWDRIEMNEVAHTVMQALALHFAPDPPQFMARTPHGYHERAAIEADLRSAGFGSTAAITTITLRGHAPSARAAAVALCQGTPMRHEIEQRGATALDEATEASAAALAARFGNGAINGRIQAIVVEVEA